VLDEGARQHRVLDQSAALDRLRSDFDKLMEMCDALGPDDWGGLMVTHKYMGPLPAFFYPTFQLMDYGVHSWDIRQGTGRAHGLSATPPTCSCRSCSSSGRRPPTRRPMASRARSGCASLPATTPGCGGRAGPAGVQLRSRRVRRRRAGGARLRPGSFVLTAFGRSNSGTISGDVRSPTGS
jgi:hypothetical protein